jgi:hypothetical protein
MNNPFAPLFALQLHLVNQYIALTRGILDFCLTLQAPPVKTVRVSTSRSLTPVDPPSRRSR